MIEDCFGGLVIQYGDHMKCHSNRTVSLQGYQGHSYWGHEDKNSGQVSVFHDNNCQHVAYSIAIPRNECITVPMLVRGLLYDKICNCWDVDLNCGKS